MDIKEEVLSLKDELVSLRRDFHKHPELGFNEKRTAGIVENYLKDCGLEVKSGVAKTGVVGLLKGKEGGQTVLLRADMDALPIEELNNVPYKSVNKGIMHACGHDGHTAMLLVAAKVLSRHRDEIKGNVKFVFQPSEEKDPGGAIKMIEEGVMENPHVDKAFGLHLGNMIPAGIIGIKEGVMTAEADRFKIEIKGKGGHGAYPHTSVDPVVIASQIVMSLQTIVSREINPINPIVITVGKIHSGDVFNVIPESAELLGTVRTLDKNLAKTIPEKIERIAKNTAAAFRGEAKTEYAFGYPPLINSKEETQYVISVARNVVGEKRVVKTPVSMGGEDMAYFLEKAKGAFFWLGSMNKEKGLDKPHHSAYFDFDEDVMSIGVEMHVKIALGLLK
ncbi:MAG: amidohydrolase [Caldisericaceae bacterium]|nr:amidohydrolase [Caldisericaceae bacterium]